MQNNIEKFSKKGYCVVKSAISKELTEFTSQYALFDEAQNFSPDDKQVIGAHARYSDAAMETMLLHLHPIIEKNTGLTLYPTYSYYRIYRNGDKLDMHKDRPSCEISATMSFNYSYSDKDFQWPIFMDGYKANLKPSDLIIYRGCDLDHWREELVHNEPVWHIQGFFHYVKQTGIYSAYKYDGRERLGEE